SARSTQPIPLLGRITLRAVLNAAGQTVAFFTGTSGAGGSFTTLGAAIATGATTLSGGVGQAVQVGLGNAFFARVNGQAHGGQGVGGSSPGRLRANPVFTSQTAGVTSFADAQGNTWTMNGTAELSNRSYRFHGELASLPQAQDPSGTDLWVPVTASG